MPYPDTTDEEDFKNRFRPVPLASPAPAEMMNGGTATLYPPTVAGRNLATRDTSLAMVNAAGRSTTLPGVGMEGSTPSTDITNLNLAASMERADLAGRTVATPTIAATAMDEFSQRRQEIENQKTQLMAKLGMIPPSAAGFAAVVLPSGQRGRHGEPSEYDKALGQLHSLDQQSRQLLQEHHYSSVENAKTAHEDLARQTHIQVSSGLAKVLNGINQINQQYPHGSPEAHSAILNLVGSNDPDVAAARGTSSFEKLVRPYANMQDLSAKRAEFVRAFGREPTSVEMTSTGGVNLRAGAGTKAEVPAAVLKDYTTLQANRAADQAYLDAETDPKLKPELQKKIGVYNAQINAFHQQFPSLAPKEIVTTTEPTVKAPQTAIDHLATHPELKDQFRKKYGYLP